MDRDTVLRLAREKNTLQYQGITVSIYANFSYEVQKLRAKFQDCKRRLLAENLKNAMMHPAMLCITADGSNHFFTSPKELNSWLDTWNAAPY